MKTSSGTNRHTNSANCFADTYRRADSLFAWLLPVQYVGLVILAFVLTPRTWDGHSEAIHMHIWMSIGLGGLISGLPTLLAWTRPGALTTRLSVGAAQLMISALLIHIGGGRSEMHFHVFVSLAFLFAYLDYGVLAIATVVAAADHLGRAIYWPESVFGVPDPAPWRAIEHAVWVVFEDAVLIFMIYRARAEKTQLHSAMSRVNQLARVLHEDHVTTSAKTPRATEDINAGMDFIQAAMQQISESVAGADNQTRGLQKLADEAVQAAKQGSNDAEQTCQSMKLLEETSQQIAVAVKEISSIAEQTRMLALNATIEAARAGRGGGGFAVVATQVKELANKSAGSAEKISAAAHGCVSRIRESTESAQTLNQRLLELSERVTSADDLIHDVQHALAAQGRQAQRIAESLS